MERVMKNVIAFCSGVLVAVLLATCVAQKAEASEKQVVVDCEYTAGAETYPFKYVLNPNAEGYVLGLGKMHALQWNADANGKMVWMTRVTNTGFMHVFITTSTMESVIMHSNLMDETNQMFEGACAPGTYEVL